MARVCAVCGKRTESGNQITRRGLARRKGGVGRKITGRAPRKFKPNVQRIRVLIGKTPTRMRVCVRCLKAGKVRKAR
jgi:large subunit ribosomal protein L28